MLTAPEPNATPLRVLLCLPTAPALPPGENGDFGGSSIYGQLSDKPLLAFVNSHGVRDMKHNRDEKLNAEYLPVVRRAAGLRPPCRSGSCRLNYTRDVPEPHPTRRDLALQNFECADCGAVKTKVLSLKPGAPPPELAA